MWFCFRSSNTGTVRSEVQIAMNWYYNLNGEAVGPVDEKGVKEHIADGTLGGETLIWNPEMETWRTLNDIQPDWLTITPDELGSLRKEKAAAGSASPRRAFWKRLLGRS